MAREGCGVRRSSLGASIRVGPRSIPTPQRAPSHLERAGAYAPECLISSGRNQCPAFSSKIACGERNSRYTGSHGGIYL